MRHFKEWLSSKDTALYETLYGQAPQEQPKKVAQVTDNEKGKAGWQPDVQEYPSTDHPGRKSKDDTPKNTIWVQNADQWTEKDRTAK